MTCKCPKRPAKRCEAHFRGVFRENFPFPGGFRFSLGSRWGASGKIAPPQQGIALLGYRGMSTYGQKGGRDRVNQCEMSFAFLNGPIENTKYRV